MPLMRLINKTSGKTLTKNLKLAQSYTDNLFGLLKEPKGTSMLFKTRFGLHTCNLVRVQLEY